jgi:hypothetical protein
MSCIREFLAVTTKLYQYYNQISAMTLDTYERQVLMDALNMVDDLAPFSSHQRRQGFAIMLKILSTTAGVFFLGFYKSLCKVFLEKAEECMDIVHRDDDYELRDIVSNFTQANADVFSAHGIACTIYFRDGQRDEMMQSFWNEDEYEEDQEYENYHEDDFYEREYEHHYSDEDDDDEEIDEELAFEMMAQDQEQLAELHAQEEEEERRKEQEKNLQSWKNKMTIVHDHLLRRNDPFYAAGIDSQIKKKNAIQDQEYERQITALTTIIGNALRESENEEIDDKCDFKVDSNLVENLLDCKVVSETSKKFGCSVFVNYMPGGCGGRCEVFDGTYTHELDTFANISVTISTLKKQMISECLYDTQLVCKDVASLIATFL